MNHQSSWSHTIFWLTIQNVHKIEGQADYMTESFLNFIDLAGSEKVSNHQNYGDNLHWQGSGYSSDF